MESDKEIVQHQLRAMRDLADVDRLRLVEALRDLSGRAGSMAALLDDAPEHEHSYEVYRLNSWVQDRTTLVRDAIGSYLASIRASSALAYTLRRIDTADSFRRLDAEIAAKWAASEHRDEDEEEEGEE